MHYVQTIDTVLGLPNVEVMSAHQLVLNLLHIKDQDSSFM